MKLEEGLKAVDKAITEMADPVVESKRQIIVARRQELRQLHNKGYSWEQIAAQLTANGLQISGNTLKMYINTASKSRAAKASDEALKKRRQPAARKPGAAQAASQIETANPLPSNATEATANGAPVLARRIR